MSHWVQAAQSAASEWYNTSDLIDKLVTFGTIVLTFAAAGWKYIALIHARFRAKAAAILAAAIHQSTSSLIDEKMKPVVDKIDQVFKQITENGFRASEPTLRDKVGYLDQTLHELLAVQRSNRDNSVQPLFECDAGGRCYWVNPALANLFGLTESEMTAADGRGWLESIENPNETFEAWMQSVNNKVPYNHDYVIANKKTGQRILCTAYGKPVYDKTCEKIIRWNGSVNPKGAAL